MTKEHRLYRLFCKLCAIRWTATDLMLDIENRRLFPAHNWKIKPLYYVTRIEHFIAGIALNAVVFVAGLKRS